MASDGDLLDADGEDAAPAQRVLQVYNVSLVTALDGNVTSKRFRSKMVDNLEVMREILGRDDFDFSDTDALPDSAIEAMDLSNAATFFKAGENYEGPAKKKRSPKAMMRRAAKSVILSARMEADARAADQRRLELRESIEQSLARERVTALAQSKMRGEDNVRYSVTRLNYLDLAQKLFDAGRYQKGYELLSSARALGEVAKIEAEAIARRRAKADAAQNPMDADAALQDLRAQAKVNPGPRAADDFEIARSHPLEQTFRDLTTRRDDLRTRAAAMLKLYTKVNGADDPSTARLDTLLTNAGELPAIQPETLDLTPLAQGASDDAIVNFDAGVVILQARHDEWDAAMDGYDTALDELDGLGLDDAKAALKDTLKALKKLVHTSGGVAERDDGNVDGIGTIALRGKAEDIPQELVRPVVAQIEALEYMAEGSSMSAEQYGLMEEFRDAALAQITALSDGKRDYAAIADAIEKIEALLEHDAFAYWASEKSKLGTDLEQLRKDLLIDSASGAWVKAEALLAEAGQSKTGAKLYRTQFGELLAHYTAVKEEQTKSYQDALKALVALPVDASGAQAWASKLKDLKTTFNDHGAVHAAFEAIWATATPGDPTTYDNTRSAIDDLKQRLETEQRSMGIALSQAQAYLVQNADTTLRDWLADPNTVPGMARPVAAAIADMTDAKREEEQTKALTKSISDLDGEMRKYIRLNAGGFTLDPRVNIAARSARTCVRPSRTTL